MDDQQLLIDQLRIERPAAAGSGSNGRRRRAVAGVALALTVVSVCMVAYAITRPAGNVWQAEHARSLALNAWDSWHEAQR